MPASAARYRSRLAAACIAVIALLPLAALLLPAVVPASPQTAAQRLIVLLPSSASDLPQAAALLDAAQARPLGQGAWSGLWLVAATAPDAVTRLYSAGAHLVLAGDGLLAGCLSFASTPPARKAS